MDAVQGVSDPVTLTRVYNTLPCKQCEELPFPPGFLRSGCIASSDFATPPSLTACNPSIPQLWIPNTKAPMCCFPKTRGPKAQDPRAWILDLNRAVSDQQLLRNAVNIPEPTEARQRLIRFLTYDYAPSKSDPYTQEVAKPRFGRRLDVERAEALRHLPLPDC